jgi:hypothetical protein
MTVSSRAVLRRAAIPVIALVVLAATASAAQAGTYKHIRNPASGLVLTDGKPGVGAVGAAASTGSTKQQWRLVGAGWGVFQIKNRGTQRCLDVQRPLESSVGGALASSPCNGSDVDQLWTDATTAWGQHALRSWGGGDYPTLGANGAVWMYTFQTLPGSPNWPQQQHWAVADVPSPGPEPDPWPPVCNTKPSLPQCNP